MRPLLLIGADGVEAVDRIRAGAAHCQSIVVLGIPWTALWNLAGLDALFMTLPMAENWGSRPGPPHTCSVLPTPTAERAKGFPPYVVTGITLHEGEPFTGPTVVKMAARAIVESVVRFNRTGALPICVIGWDAEKFWPGGDSRELGRLVAEGYEEGVRA